MALSHVKTDLLSRIRRWTQQTRATKILLHPSDYKILQNAGRQEAIEQGFNMKVECLGGEEALARFIAGQKDEGEES